MSDAVSWSTIIPLVSGGLAGAVVSVIAATARSRRELALSFVDKYVAMFDDVAKAITLLKDPHELGSAKARNKVSAVANWLDVVCACYLEGMADCKVLDLMGLPPICRQYFQAMKDAETIGADGVHHKTFDQATLDRFDHLNRVTRGQRPSCMC